jgi:hypothetical protein
MNKVSAAKISKSFSKFLTYEKFDVTGLIFGKLRFEFNERPMKGMNVHT